ncbi:MAG TPA: hypothetical protein VGB18_00110 [Candidatus Thermoplasmatota archaeon]
MQIWALAATVVFLGVSGCLGEPHSLSTTMETGASSESPADVVLASAANCVQASAVMAYTGTGKQGPFEEEDVRSDFPDGRFTTLGVPVTGPTSAIYTSFMNCYNDGEELLFGFVGTRVRAPAWDADGIERHYAIIHLFYGDAEASHPLGEWLGVHVDPLASGVIRLAAADTYHLSFSTGTKMGDYDEIIQAPPVAREAPTTIRLWATSGDPETRQVRYRAIDIQDTFGEAGSDVGASGNGFILHWKNDLHGPAVAGQYVLGFGQPSWSEHYSGFSRSIAYGPTHIDP